MRPWLRQQAPQAGRAQHPVVIRRPHYHQRLDALRRSTAAAVESVKLVKPLYLTGLIDFQNVLDRERSLFEEQDSLADSEGRVAQNLIRVYRTLGGGWSPEPGG